MSLFELFLIAIGLSMDAFAVSVCKGLSMGKMNHRHALIIGLLFRRLPGPDAFFGIPAGEPGSRMP